jgi:hypothetical protein
MGELYSGNWICVKYKCSKHEEIFGKDEELF